MPVDRKALYEKLEKMGLSMKSVYRENHATVAVEEFVASEATSKIAIEAKGEIQFDAGLQETTVHHTCPKCGEEWESDEEVSVDEAWIDPDYLMEHVSVGSEAVSPALSPGSLVLTAEEVVYMVLDFAHTQGGER